MLPDGLPTGADEPKRIVKTDDTLAEDKLQEYLKHPKPAGKGEERMDTPGGGSMAIVTSHLMGVDFPASKQKVLACARDKDAPDAVMAQLRKLPDATFTSMADIVSGIGER